MAAAIVALGSLASSAFAETPATPQTKPVAKTAAPVASASATPSSAVPEDMVSRKLKAALGESEMKLGELEVWQKRIFEEEAVPQYQRFIRNYRSAQTHSGSAISNLEVDIDMDSLKNYLKFYAPKTLGRDEKNATALMYLRADSNCEKCVAAGPGIRKLAQNRVERRGLTAVWLTAEDVGVGADGAELQGKALDDKVAELAQSRNAAASLVMQWGPAPADDVDTAHADEKHFILHSLILARGLAGTGRLAPSKQMVATATGSVDLLEVDPFEAAAAKLFSDAFVELGAQAAQAELALLAKGAAGGADDEIDIDVSGIRDFEQLGRLKAQIQAKLPTAGLEERKISRGRAVLAVTGEKAGPDAVRTQLAGLPLDPAGTSGGKLVPLEASGTAPASASEHSMSADAPPTIAMEIRP